MGDTLIRGVNVTASVEADRKRLVMWIASAIQETALPSTPWNLVEVEMLERLAAILAEEQPLGCRAGC